MTFDLVIAETLHLIIPAKAHDLNRMAISADNIRLL